MKWIVGLDLGDLSQGALQLATWLASTSRSPEPERFVAVHVLEAEHLREVLLVHHLDEVSQAARDAARAAVERSGTKVEGIEIVQDRFAEEGLARACASAGADGILVGRLARRASHRIVRLGRVARRLLRAMPAPVVVAPPDLRAGDLGDGPVVALSALEDAGAVPYASDLARRLGRLLVVAHVVKDVEHDPAPFLPDVSRERLAAERVARAGDALAAAVARHAPAAEAVLLRGDVVERAVALCAERRAPLLVVGARRREGLDLVLPGLGSDLAAVAPIPVVLVPAAGE